MKMGQLAIGIGAMMIIVGFAKYLDPEEKVVIEEFIPKGVHYFYSTEEKSDKAPLITSVSTEDGRRPLQLRGYRMLEMRNKSTYIEYSYYYEQIKEEK